MWQYGMRNAISCISVVIIVAFVHELWSGGTLFIKKGQIPAVFQNTYQSIGNCLGIDGSLMLEEGRDAFNCFVLNKPKLENIAKATFSVIAQDNYSNCLDMVPLVKGNRNMLNVIKTCTINSQRLDDSILELYHVIGSVKTYACILTLGVIVCTIYQTHPYELSIKSISPKTVKQIQLPKNKAIFKHSKQSIHAPGVIVQKVSSYHGESVLSKKVNTFNSPTCPTDKYIFKEQNALKVKPSECTAEIYQSGKEGHETKTHSLVGSNLNEEIMISSKDASTPKKKEINESFLEQSGRNIDKPFNTKNILKSLESLSLDLSDFVCTKHVIQDKKNSKNDFKAITQNLNCRNESQRENAEDSDDTISLNSNQIAQNVALTAIGNIKEKENIQFLNPKIKQDLPFFLPYHKQQDFASGWTLTPGQGSVNNTTVPVRRLAHLPAVQTLSNVPQLVSMSPLGHMHHLNQLNSVVPLNLVPPFYSTVTNHNQMISSLNLESDEGQKSNIW